MSERSNSGSLLIGGLIIAWLIYGLFSTFFSNVFNLAVKRDFGWAQYWQNIGDFHGGDKCYFFAQSWLQDEDYYREWVLVRELPSYPFKITTTGVEKSELKSKYEHRNFVKSHFKRVVIDDRNPIFIKYRGLRERTFQIEGDKFLKQDYKVVWTAVSIYEDSDSFHGYLLISPDMISRSSDSFEPKKEYQLDTVNHQQLIRYLKAEDKFPYITDENNRYAAVFDDACVASIKDRRR
jgi:hypothetical protein